MSPISRGKFVIFCSLLYFPVPILYRLYIYQVATTLNIDCPKYMDWFHGGLQFQVEHHLWPRLPRHSLRRARDLVKAFCAEHKVHCFCVYRACLLMYSPF